MCALLDLPCKLDCTVQIHYKIRAAVLKERSIFRFGFNSHVNCCNALKLLCLYPQSAGADRTMVRWAFQESIQWRCPLLTNHDYPNRKAVSNWNVKSHGDWREGKWRGNWRMVWVVSTLHTTSEHGVSSITTADVHTSAASSRLNWRLRRFKRTRPFRR